MALLYRTAWLSVCFAMMQASNVISIAISSKVRTTVVSSDKKRVLPAVLSKLACRLGLLSAKYNDPDFQ